MRVTGNFRCGAQANRPVEKVEGWLVRVIWAKVSWVLPEPSERSVKILSLEVVLVLRNFSA